MTTSKITTSTPLCIRENEPMISTQEHLYTSPAVEMDYRLYTRPLIQHTNNQRIFFLTQETSIKTANKTRTLPCYTKSHKQACKITLHLPRMHPHQNSILQKPHSRTSQAQRSPAIACTQMHGQRNHSPRNANFARN